MYPESAGTRQPQPMSERWAALGATWPVLVIFALVVGGIYLGWFTPTEGSAIGAAGTGIVALLSGSLNWQVFADSLLGTARTTAMIFFIILGAAFYNDFLALSGVPQFLADWVLNQGFSAWLVLAIVLVFYLIFGCLMDSLSMILLAIPFFWPVIAGLDFGMSVEDLKIWFGILALIVVELGLITPPVGMNVFVINSLARDVPMIRTFIGVAPFFVAELIRVALLIAFPALSLWLPSVLAR
jgi:tripartite ATP-independent transporter DctM subunit